MALYGQLSDVDTQLQGNHLRQVDQYAHPVDPAHLDLCQVGFGLITGPFDAGDNILAMLCRQSGDIFAAGLMDDDGICPRISVAYDFVAGNGIAPFGNHELGSIGIFRV